MSGESTVFWQREAPAAIGAPLGEDLDVDVLVIGGGYTGLSAARCLKEAEPGLRVAVVERDFVGFGASGRNSGFLTGLIRHDLSTLRRRLGDERGRAVAAFGEAAVDHVVEVARRHPIDCDLELTGLVNPALSPAQERLADRLHAAAAALGVASERWDGERTRAALGVPSFRGAFRAVKGGLLQPFKLAQGLAAAARARGVEIYERTPVDSLELGRVIRAQAGGRAIRARHLVVATNAYTREPRAYRRHFAPIHVYSIVTAPLTPAQWAAIGGWPGREGFYTLHHILYALRPTADGRLLAATGNVRFYWGDRLHVAESPDYAMLERAIAWLWPALAGIEVEARWEGVIGVTLSDLPSMGRHPRHPNVVHALAYCGHGVALATYAGTVVRDLLLGRPGAHEDLPFVGRAPFPPVPGEPLRSAVAAGYLGVLRGLDALANRAARRAR